MKMFLLGSTVGFAVGYLFSLVCFVLTLKDPPLSDKIHKKLHLWADQEEDDCFVV